MQRDPKLWISSELWRQLACELHRRTDGRHEAGAFLLGRVSGGEREATAIVYYDDLDPRAYDSGVCVLHAPSFSRLWEICETRKLSVVADAHVHPFGARQSRSDRESPMIARPGHIALILPLMAKPPIRRWAIGIYEYLGDHRWKAHGGCQGSTILRIGDQP